MKKNKQSLDRSETGRGFGIYRFPDANGHACSLQQSSAICDEGLIWLGPDDASPQLFRKEGGWRPVPFPKGTLFTTRMHLTQSQVRALLPLLQSFADTGRLP